MGGRSGELRKNTEREISDTTCRTLGAAESSLESISRLIGECRFVDCTIFVSLCGKSVWF